MPTITIDYKEFLLFHRNQTCAHCNHTGVSDTTFDKLCPHCTPSHCVMCGRVGTLTKIESLTTPYHLCPRCRDEEEMH